MRLPALIAILFLLGFGACSSTQESYRSQVPYTRNYIFEYEIKSSSATNAFDLIESLRPHWVEGRGVKSFRSRTASNPIVYVDSQRHGDILSLTTIPVDNIVEIRFMSSGDATIRFGIGHSGGAILIIMFY